MKNTINKLGILLLITLTAMSSFAGTLKRYKSDNGSWKLVNTQKGVTVQFAYNQCFVHDTSGSISKATRCTYNDKVVYQTPLSGQLKVFRDFQLIVQVKATREKAASICLAKASKFSTKNVLCTFNNQAILNNREDTDVVDGSIFQWYPDLQGPKAITGLKTTVGTLLDDCINAKENIPEGLFRCNANESNVIIFDTVVRASYKLYINNKLANARIEHVTDAYNECVSIAKKRSSSHVFCTHNNRLLHSNR